MFPLILVACRLKFLELIVQPRPNCFCTCPGPRSRLSLVRMTTAVTPNSRKIRKIRSLKEKYGKKYGNKNMFDVFDVFCRFFFMFLRSWRPGRPCKSFLEVVRFSSTEYEPVASHRSAKSSIFYVFRPPFRPTGSSILTFFVAKQFFDEGSDTPRPIPQDPHRNSAQNDVPASSPSLF